MNEIDFIEKSLVDHAKRMPLEEAVTLLLNFAKDKTVVEQAAARIREAAAKIRTLKDPRAFSNPSEPWYVGPTDSDVVWPAYVDRLRGKGWAVEDIARIDRGSSKILSLMLPPGAGVIDTRGLVIGYVQSGKTANYAGLIAKAADVGYRFFVVLTGIIEALRRQTQERIEKDIVAKIPTHWVQVTSQQSDFHEHVNVNAFLADHSNQYTIAVVKKNGLILRRLLQWLKGARAEVLRNCPVLVIDDEADLASINTARGNLRTTINRQILDLLSALPKAAYVGFTATPFANVLIDPTDRDLYPKDFIVDLDRPDSYFGAERLFGRDRLTPDEPESVSDGLDMIRLVPDDEADLLRPARAAVGSFSPQITPSLRESILYFWLATAARRSRGQEGDHSTMLIHTSMYARAHEGFRAPVEEFTKAIRRSLSENRRELHEEFRLIWEREQARVNPSELGCTPVTYDALSPHLQAVLDDSTFAVENSFSLERLDYSLPGRVYIVVGGNVLSRGLTLEGLVVSFFIRTATAYDTLLQMGRWFGYRPGYPDLPRVWMTNELEGDFYDLATVEREIRNDVAVYETEKLNPLQFAVRIRLHPTLSITSQMKMRNAINAEMSYSLARPQTIYFHHKDKDWLDGNLLATRELIAAVRDAGIEHSQVEGSYLFREVGRQLVLKFIEQYGFHELNQNMKKSLLKGYIAAQSQQTPSSLRSWNVAVVSQRKSPRGTIDLGFGEVPLLSRSRLKGGRTDNKTADLKAIMSNSDLVLDLSPRPDLKIGASQLVKRRSDSLKDTGLLLLYPIAKDSQPDRVPSVGKEETREPLGAAEHMIGVALVFPEASKDTPQGYLTAKVPDSVYVEEIDDAELSEAL